MMNAASTLANLARHFVRWIQAHRAVNRRRGEWLTHATVVSKVAAMQRSGIEADLGRNGGKSRFHFLVSRLDWLCWPLGGGANSIETLWDGS